MYRIFLFLIMFGLAPIANANVFVLYNNTTKEVLSISAEDDAVVPSGYTKTVLSGKLSDYPMEYNNQDYLFVNKRFVVNMKKISDREKANLDALETAAEIESVKKAAYLKAYQEMLTAGIKFKNIDESTFK